MRWTRSSSGACGLVSITPASRTDIPAPASSTAYPVKTSAGSMPSTRRRRGTTGAPPSGRGDGLHDLVRDVVVRVDRLDVVQLLQRLDEAQHLGCLLALHTHRRLREKGHLGLDDGHTIRLELGAHGVHFTR